METTHPPTTSKKVSRKYLEGGGACEVGCPWVCGIGLDGHILEQVLGPHTARLLQLRRPSAEAQGEGRKGSGTEGRDCDTGIQLMVNLCHGKYCERI